jgi:hypothetical protein
MDKQQSYLDDPNYWRLSYQLAAQRLNAFLALGGNWAAEQMAQLEEAIRQADSVPESIVVVMGDLRAQVEEAERQRAAAARAASDLIAAAGDTIKRCAAAIERRGPSVGEQRLLRFLERTVRPCAEIVAAATELHSGELKKADARVERVRKSENSVPLGYRVNYNFACYESDRAGQFPEDRKDDLVRDEGLDRALVDLRRALRKAHGRPRAEIISRAKEDPALATVRDDPDRSERFETLLRLYAVSQKPTAPSSQRRAHGTDSRSAQEGQSAGA